MSYKILCGRVVACLLLSLSLPALAIMQPKEVVVPIAAPTPKIQAEAWALMEMNSGWIVTGKDVQTPRPPASITKLMANYVLFSELTKGSVKMEDMVPISEKAWRAEGSRMFADVNTKISFERLLRSMVIQSGNDASIALAEFVGGSEEGFAALMNKAAREIGLRNSFFVNSTGLTAENHAMSAADILVLSAAIIRDFPEYYPWFSQKTYTHNNIKQENRNRLLWKDPTVDGLKTGFTDAAGYCLVASAKRGDQRWLAVAMGTESTAARERAVRTLLEYGFKNFEPASLLDQQGGLASVTVYGGDADELRLQVAELANIVVPAGRTADIQKIIDSPAYLEAPIAAGVAAGLVRLTLDGQEIYSTPLIAMSTIDEAGWWKGFVDSIKLRWRKFRED